MRNWQTFLRDGRAVLRQHWKLLVLPIPLALLITIWVVVSTPTMYQSQAAIWSDITSPQAAASAQAANGATLLTPAAQQQSLLNELLATNSFRTTVATTSPLAAWLQANPPSTLTPSGLTGVLHGTPALTERIRSTLLSGTSTTVNGPQVMTVSFAAQSASLAHDTLQAMLNTFSAQRAQLAAQAQGAFRVLDAPSTPAGPTSGASKSLQTVLIGLLAGIATTIGLVAIMVLLRHRKRRAGLSEGPEPSRNGAGDIAIPAAAPTAVTVAGAHEHGVAGEAAPGSVLAQGPEGVADANGHLAPTEPPAAELAQEPADLADANGHLAPTEPPAAEQVAPPLEASRIDGVVRDVRVVRSDSTRRVLWVVATASGAPEIPRRTRVVLEGSPHGPGTVRRSERTANGNDVYLELSGVLSSAPRDGMPAAADKAWIGHELTLVAIPAASAPHVPRRSRA